MLRCIARDARSGACSAEADIVSMAGTPVRAGHFSRNCIDEAPDSIGEFSGVLRASAIRVKRTVRHSPLGCVAPYPPTLGPRLWQSSACLTCQHAAEQRTSRCRLALTVSRTPCVDCRARHLFVHQAAVTHLRPAATGWVPESLAHAALLLDESARLRTVFPRRTFGSLLDAFRRAKRKRGWTVQPLLSATPMLASASRRKPQERPDRLRERSPLSLRQLSIEADHGPALLIAGHDGHPLPFVLDHML